ncbi:MAG TPA: site-specific DNA-methyltransferase [Anaerolineae bacterium]|nr:site-specific DNA-methyltransferase [Anaerolineae bacterium]
MYYGKQREEDILADTMAVPLQPVSTFGKNGDDWHNMLIFGDNLQVLKRLLEMKEQGKLLNADGTPGVRLVYIDPPFATKQEFRGTQDQKAYQDKVAGAQFVEFLRKRLVLLRELLSDDGCIYVHLDYRKIHYAKVVLDEILGEQNLVNEITWQRTASHNDPGRYGCVHDTLLFFRKGSAYVWNGPKTAQSQEYIDAFFVYAESPDRKTWTKLKKGEHAPLGWERYRLGNLASPHPRPNLTYEYRGYKPPENGWKVSIDRMRELDKQGLLHFPSGKDGRIQTKQYLKDTVGNKAVSDVWVGISPLQAQSSEKQNYPTQKPEALLERIVYASSNPGDIVLDAFAGSGTTLAVAEKLGRRWIGIDCGKLAVYTIQKRMLNLKSEIGNKGKPLKPRPFTLYNAGLYDFSQLRQLPREDWRFFALQLFECKDKPDTIGGIQIDGTRKGAPVLVFNHHAQPGKRIDEDTVREIHDAVHKKIGSKFHIIAPRGAFDFQQDYLDIEGIRYYALRIPYSVINELHHRSFAALRQPNDEMDVNDIVDAWGFDFIQPPQLVYTTSVKKRKGQMISEACLKIKKFESRARIRGEDARGGFETFSTLMIDYDFNGEVFELDAVLYAHQLEADDWQAWLPAEMLGEKVMAVFLDIYGNEAREVIPRADFNLPKKTGTSAKPRKRARR